MDKYKRIHLYHYWMTGDHETLRRQLSLVSLDDIIDLYDHIYRLDKHDGFKKWLGNHFSAMFKEEAEKNLAN